MDEITVRSLSKSFPSAWGLKDLAAFNSRSRRRLDVLKNVSFTAEKGEIIGIVGENGAGKTTLLKALAGLLLPTGGEIKISGLNPAQDGQKLKKKVGICLNQERSFYWRLSGRENLHFFAAMHGLDGKEAVKGLFTLARVLNLDEDILDKRFDSLSAGMMKKFSILRSLIHDPGVVLFDEPAKSLDYQSSMNFAGYVKDSMARAEHKTVLYASHDMPEAERLCGRFLVLHKGSVAGFGALKELGEGCGRPGAGLGEIFLTLTKGGPND